ncbi:FAD-binding oxidoreductase [Sphingorhabdus sp.]|jgi:glycine/D-amino acid oxidase-like deaminating enzyme|uniref:NAD(P)/FAD-dependent oxidoreductase n=1 Tax=Sphingorhabdus sp. TaxID=1902408 RepID=UPI002D0911D8|nr:FAD-binding oxidoreductase [Sphingorhabdus sp.]HMT42261.1 FAD-binding oxidoreductase [Sphingorhabdus sp.]
MKMSTNIIYKPEGGWIEPPSDIQHALNGQATADVIIVGGGFAGLSTALELRARGADVIVLESRFAGFGASGRNAGYLAGGQGLDYHMFMKRLDRSQVAAIIRYFEEGVRYVESKLESYGIDCDYRRSGLIRAGVHSSQEKQLRANMELGIELGAPAEFLDNAAMRARGIPPAFLFGYATPGGGTLNPGKYVRGLRQAALEHGVRLFENSPLMDWSDGKIIECRTPDGTVRAPHLVVAANAFAPGLGLLKDKVVPLRVSAIETHPLTPTQRASLDWPNAEGITTQHLVMESHRLTAHNTLVITTKQLGYSFGSSTPEVPDNHTYRKLEIALRDRFPTLHDVGVKAAWSGYISFAFDGLPVVGVTGEHDNILYTAGCSGHGVGTQSLVGLVLAERIGGTENPFLSALQHATPKTLPEPLQWVAVRSLLGAAHAADEHVNRKVRRGG